MGSRLSYPKRPGPAIQSEKRWAKNPRVEDKTRVFEISTSAGIFMSALNLIISRAKKEHKIGKLITYKGIQFKLCEDDNAKTVMERFMRIHGYTELKFK